VREPKFKWVLTRSRTMCIACKHWRLQIFIIIIFDFFCVLRAALALAKKIFGPKYKSMTLEV
jgi:hypothetical protein